MPEIKHQVVLARITATPFNSGTLDSAMRALLEEVKAEAKGLILVLTGVSDIEEFRTEVEAAEAAVAGIRDQLPATFGLEVAYYLASQRLMASVRGLGGKPWRVRSDDGGLFGFGEQPSVDVETLMTFTASGYTMVVLPPICTRPPVATMNVDMFTRLLASQLGTSVIEY